MDSGIEGPFLAFCFSLERFYPVIVLPCSRLLSLLSLELPLIYMTNWLWLGVELAPLLSLARTLLTTEPLTTLLFTNWMPAAVEDYFRLLLLL